MANTTPKPSLKERANHCLSFFTKTIWEQDVRTLQRSKWLGYSLCRTLILAIRGFISDRCTLQASALTYITLVSIVPILAITLAFCKGIGLQNKLLESIGIREVISTENGVEEHAYEVIIQQPTNGNGNGNGQSTNGTASATDSSTLQGDEEDNLSAGFFSGKNRKRFISELPEAMQDAILKLLTYVDKTNFAALGIVGMITLLSTVVMSIKKLEDNFNAIWRVKRGRTIARQFSEYLVVLLMMPIAILLILSLDQLLSSDKIAAVLHISSTTALFCTVTLGRLVLFSFLSAAFVFLYTFMPNTKVQILPAIISGVVTAAIWGGVLLAYIYWQVGLARFNAIYGTFAAMPFFLAWLYAEWVVVLCGAELCYAIQNHRILRCSKDSTPLAPSASHLLGLVLMIDICSRYHSGKGTWNAAIFAASHAISITQIEHILGILSRNSLVLQLSPDSDAPDKYNYVPARSPEQLSCADVSRAFTGIHCEESEHILKYLPSNIIRKLEKHHQDSVLSLKSICLIDSNASSPKVH